jgi:hypothetical protein
MEKLISKTDIARRLGLTWYKFDQLVVAKGVMPPPLPTGARRCYHWPTVREALARHGIEPLQVPQVEARTG